MTFKRTSDVFFNRAQSAIKQVLKTVFVVSISLVLAGCHQVAPIGHALFGHTTPVSASQMGAVAADEPRAAMVGRNVLAAGGHAADAATAVALALTVTLPSRASLGGGGACLISQAGQAPKAILFLPVPGGDASASRPAAAPMMLRGIYRMQRDYGRVRFEDLMTPAITLAAQGTSVSSRLASDIKAVHAALFADDASRTVFARGDAQPLEAGDRLVQVRLARFLSRIQRLGVGDLYNGALSDFFISEANRAGGGLTHASMRNALPIIATPLELHLNQDTMWFLPPPADGGLGAAAAFKVGGSAQAAVANWRVQKGGGDNAMAAQAWLDQARPMSGALPALPASTSFAVMDRSGGAVACSLTENNLFGTGRVASLTGVVLGASPDTVPQPLLSAAIVTQNKTARAALAASGQSDAADALAEAVKAAAARTTISQETSLGRVNAVTCVGQQCVAATDPRGQGLSLDTASQGARP